MNRRKFLTALGIAPIVATTVRGAPAQEVVGLVQAENTDNQYVDNTVTIVRDTDGRIKNVIIVDRPRQKP